MAKQCGDGCHVICDFCTYYSDNGTRNDRDFAGYGICTLAVSSTGAGDSCDDFVCLRIKENEEVSE